MKNKKKRKLKKNWLLLLVVIVLAIGGIIYYNSRPKLIVVSVVSKIDDYSYYLESNATKIYKKYYKELENELKDSKIDEENYAKLISKLFAIDFYTLNNKVTNKDIGGVQFIHSNLKEDFVLEASNTIYKYVENNLYGKRKQSLPEVKSVDVEEIKNIKYKEKDYKDDSGYDVKIKIGYVKDMDYPKELELKIIHEDNKLVIVEIK